MDLREMTAFREVARQSSFARAALALGYVQSTVSAQIQSLERDLGVRLFDRLGRTVVLTAAGRALLPHAERMLETAAIARADVSRAVNDSGEVSGSVTVGAPESLLIYRLPSILSCLRRRHPQVTVNIRPSAIGRFRGNLRRALADGSVDVALVLDTPLSVPGFTAERLVSEPTSVIASPLDSLASASRVVPKDLDDAVVLLPEAPDSGCVYRAQFEQQLSERHVTPRSSLEFASIEAVKQCVVAGMGVSVLPSVAVEADVVAGRLVRLPWAGRFAAITQMVWNGRRVIDPALAAFLGAAREVRVPPDAGASNPGRRTQAKATRTRR